MFLILRRCVGVQRGDCRDLQERVSIVALMDGYFEYSQTGHMKRLSWHKATEISIRGDVDDGRHGAEGRLS